jgi:hypothetical protein
MNTRTANWTRPEAAAVTGLVLSASGIGVLWVSGIEFPFYPPPGMLLMLTGAAAFTVLRTRVRWAPLVPAILGLSGVLGFIVEGVLGGVGIANLTGEAGAGAVAGQVLQQVGVIIAMAAGVIAAKARYRRATA